MSEATVYEPLIRALLGTASHAKADQFRFAQVFGENHFLVPLPQILLIPIPQTLTQSQTSLKQIQTSTKRLKLVNLNPGIWRGRLPGPDFRDRKGVSRCCRGLSLSLCLYLSLSLALSRSLCLSLSLYLALFIRCLDCSHPHAHSRLATESNRMHL